MGALEILMETRARKEIADQANQTQQANMLLDYALGQQKLAQDQKSIDVNTMLAEAKLKNSMTQSNLLSQFLSGSGGGNNVPPGTRINVGGLSIPLNRKYTDTEAKSLSTAESLQGQIDELIGVIQKDKANYDEKGAAGLLETSQLTGLLGPAGVTPEGQNYRLLKDAISERLLRLRSGAQINEKEYKRFTKMLPSIFRGDDLDIKQLENFKTEFAAIEGRIKEGSAFNPEATASQSDSLNVGGMFQGKKILAVRRKP